MSEIVLFRHSAYDLSIQFKPPDSPYLSDRHLKSIYNALHRGVQVDLSGRLWICESELHTILRTTKDKARYFLLKISDDCKVEVQGKRYVKGSEICRLLDEDIQSAGSIKKEMYLRFSDEVYRSMRDCDKLRNLRAEFYEYVQSCKPQLKQKRVQDLKLKADELTGCSLKKGSEFSHIRSAKVYLHLADRLWNGLVVNKETHDIITKQSINDEDELYELCLEMGWRTDWYEIFIKHLHS